MTGKNQESLGNTWGNNFTSLAAFTNSPICCPDPRLDRRYSHLNHAAAAKLHRSDLFDYLGYPRSRAGSMMARSISNGASSFPLPAPEQRQGKTVPNSTGRRIEHC